MKKTLIKDSFKEIKNSYKRFISILIIVLLGVGFFSGIKAASPDMKKTLDKYFDRLNVMDIQVVSTLGLTEEDLIVIKNIELVKDVEGSYQTDAKVKIEDEEVIVKLETYSENINKLELIEGKFPKNETECVVEQSFLKGTGHKIGDKIDIEVEDIENDEGNAQKVLKNDKLTIVGTVKTPLYISTDRGSTKLGSGVIDYYMYIPKENINVDIYTNIYINVEDAKELETTSKRYTEKIENIKEKIDNISYERKEARYNEIYNSVHSKIESAQKELNEEKQIAEQELKEAEEKLEKARIELENGKIELKNNKEKTEAQFAIAESEIEKSKDTINANELKFNEEKKNAEQKIMECQQQISLLEKTKEQLNILQDNFKKLQENLENLKKQLEQAISDEEKEEINAKIQQINIQIQQLQNEITVIQNELKQQGITNIDETIDNLKSGITYTKTELLNGENNIKDAKLQIEKNVKELNSKKNSAYYQLNQAEVKINDSENEIKKGEEELKKAKEEFNKKILDAENQLEKAKEELNEIEKPEWFVLDREQNVGYLSYIQDADRVAKLAKVFPVVFFMVASLISLTSMSRMVEEERVQIGTLKALGYNKIQIASKYLIYATLPTLIGGIIGLFIGFNLLPKVIADMYAMVYDLPEVILEINIQIAITGIAFATLSTVGATIYTCMKELKNNPATLMRPRAPKIGKRVFLEKIPFIWKHLNFIAKVTARNLFRYKKRFLMTIIGVGGCTALIVSGFGLRDAISNMIPKQFGEIYKYNVSITLKEEKSGEELEKIEKDIQKIEGIEKTLSTNIQSVKIIKDDNNQNIQLIIPNDVNKIEEFITLRDRKNKNERYILDNSGVIISEKLAKLLQIKEGENITLENLDGIRREVKVSKITENYIMHYIYCSPELYNNIFNTQIKSNVILSKTIDMKQDDENNLGKYLLENLDNIAGISFTSVSENMFNSVMENMYMVVWILIIAAGLLALIVLYSLLNANISERVRELATIKVLGFYDKEVYNYISRETIILTIIGIVIGLFGGYFLTMYILKTCELDITMFDPNVKILSYILGVIITIFFAFIVNIITYFSLKKINMIESLKSVE